jgi:transcriptional regulator with XRE-family HTH domain
LHLAYPFIKWRLLTTRVTLFPRLGIFRPPTMKNGSPVTKSKPNPIDVHVGARIRQRRKMLALSQEGLGDALEVAFQQIQKYERGANRVGASRLYALCRFFEVSPNYFFEGLPSCDGELLIRPASDLANLNVTFGRVKSAESELLVAFSQIADGDIKRCVIDLIKSLARASI